MAAKKDAKLDDKVEKSELFESKFVKAFIETFNNVLELIDEQEKELTEFIGDEAVALPEKPKPKATVSSEEQITSKRGMLSKEEPGLAVI